MRSVLIMQVRFSNGLALVMMRELISPPQTILHRTGGVHLDEPKCCTFSVRTCDWVDEITPEFRSRTQESRAVKRRWTAMIGRRHRRTKVFLRETSRFQDHTPVHRAVSVLL